MSSPWAPDSICMFLLIQAEIAQTERELKEVLFKEEVLKKEKQLLEQFAGHVSKIHSVKVTTTMHVRNYTINIILFLRLISSDLYNYDRV